MILRDVRTRSPIVDVEERARPVTDVQAFGPYRVLGELAALHSGRLLLGYDEALRRRVWIHATTGVPAVSLPRRQLARRGRLRWLTGARVGSDGWDAYRCPAARRFGTSQRRRSRGGS